MTIEDGIVVTYLDWTSEVCRFKQKAGKIMNSENHEMITIVALRKTLNLGLIQRECPCKCAVNHIG